MVVASVDRTNAKDVTPGTFERLILNRWVAQGGDFVTREQLAQCIDPDLLPCHQGYDGPYFGGLDLGLVKDRTALAIVHMADGQVVLDELQVWQGSKGAPVSIEEVETALVDADRRYANLRVSVDPWQLQSTIQKLRGQMRIEEFTFTATSIARLSETLFEAITGRSLRLYPDEALEAEILGLRTVQTAAGWRVDHGKRGFSDRAMALGLAILAASTSPIGPGIYFGNEPALTRMAKAKLLNKGSVKMEQKQPAVKILAHTKHEYSVPGAGGDYYRFLADEETWVPQYIGDMLVASHPDKLEIVARWLPDDDIPVVEPPKARPPQLVTLQWHGLTQGRWRNSTGELMWLQTDDQLELPETEAKALKKAYPNSLREVSRRQEVEEVTA